VQFIVDLLAQGWTQPGSSDPRVLEKAQAEQRIVLTFDKDFGELAFRRGLPATCGVILFRVPTRSPAQTTATILKAIDERRDWAGHGATPTSRGKGEHREDAHPALANDAETDGRWLSVEAGEREASGGPDPHEEATVRVGDVGEAAVMGR
jgi:hypothetical protein